MAFDSRTINNENNNSVLTYHHRDAHGESSGHYISSAIINIRQLQTDLHAQHQHDKGALTELNKSFQLFVDRVQLLQSQNSKYRAAIADCRRQSSDISSIDAQWSEGYLAINRDLSMVRNAKVDYRWDFEMCQLQVAIYKQLIAIEQQWKDKRSSILEEELKQSASTLNGLRISYAKMQQEVDRLYAECDDLLRQYLTLTHDYCIVKKQGNKLDISVETLKTYILFYQNLRSYTRNDFNSSSIQSHDLTQFGTLELDKIVKKIRRDFEVYYATIYRDMAASYETKIAEIEPDIKQALYDQQIEMEEFTMILQTQQMEYKKVQKSLSYEKEIQMKLEATYSKLEAELKSIQLQHEHRFELQSKDINDARESILLMAFDVDEIRRSKANLEAEIIIYHHLLGVNRTEERIVIFPHAQTVDSETTGNLVIKGQKKGSIGIKECAPNGTYISLVNSSTNKDIDISRWMLKRHIDSGIKVRYTIPDGVRLKRGSELRIYTKAGGGTAAESSSYQKLVNNDLGSWGMGNTIQTLLFNKNGDEEASYSQSIKFR